MASTPPAAPLEIVQICAVVHDLRKAVEAYHRTLGWGPWKAYVCTPPRHRDTMLRGVAVDFSMQLAETKVGTVTFELIEPLEGPSVYKEWLAERGEGLHHVACMRADGDMDATLADLRARGLEVLMSGVIDGCAYFYFDTEPVLKLVVESFTGEYELGPPDWVYP